MAWEITRYAEGRFFEFIHRESKLKGSTAYFEVVSENTGS